MERVQNQWVELSEAERERIKNYLESNEEIRKLFILSALGGDMYAAEALLAIGHPNYILQK